MTPYDHGAQKKISTLQQSRGIPYHRASANYILITAEHLSEQFTRVRCTYNPGHSGKHAPCVFAVSIHLIGSSQKLSMAHAEHSTIIELSINNYESPPLYSCPSNNYAVPWCSTCNVVINRRCANGLDQACQINPMDDVSCVSYKGPQALPTFRAAQAKMAALQC